MNTKHYPKHGLIDVVVMRDENENPLPLKDALDKALTDLPKGTKCVYGHHDHGDDGFLVSYTRQPLTNERLVQAVKEFIGYACQLRPEKVELLYSTP